MSEDLGKWNKDENYTGVFHLRINPNIITLILFQTISVLGI